MSHQAHPTITGPAFLVLVSNDVFEVRIRVLCQEALNEISGFVRRKSHEHPNLINIAGVQTDRMPSLRSTIPELQEVVGALRRSSHLARSLQTEKQQINHQTIVLEHETRELQATNQPIAVGMVHVLIAQLDVVLGGYVVGQVMVHDQTKQSVQQSKIDLLVDLGQFSLDHHVGFALGSLPNVGQVVDSLRPLVRQERRNFGV